MTKEQAQDILITLMTYGAMARDLLKNPFFLAEIASDEKREIVSLAPIADAVLIQSTISICKASMKDLQEIFDSMEATQ